MRLREILPNGAENSSYLQNVWEQEKIKSFRDFLRWYKVKNVVPTLEAMKKKIDFHHEKGFDMLILESTWPKLANICLHVSSSEKFFPFTESHKNLLPNVGEDMIEGPSIVKHAKLLLSGLTRACPQLFANRFLEYVSAIFTLTQCISVCLQNTTHDMSLMQTCDDSSPVRTNPEVSKTWSCRTFNELSRTAELRAFTEQKLRKWKTVSKQFGSADVATKCMKQWVVSGKRCSCNGLSRGTGLSN